MDLNIDAFSAPQTLSRPPALSYGLSSGNRLAWIENGMLTSLTAVSPDAMKL